MKRRLTVSVRNGHHFQWKVYERSTFFSKVVYKRVRGCTSEQSLPVPHLRASKNKLK